MKFQHTRDNGIWKETRADPEAGHRCPDTDFYVLFFVPFVPLCEISA